MRWPKVRILLGAPYSEIINFSVRLASVTNKQATLRLGEILNGRDNKAETKLCAQEIGPRTKVGSPPLRDYLLDADSTTV